MELKTKGFQQLKIVLCVSAGAAVFLAVWASVGRADDTAQVPSPTLQLQQPQSAVPAVKPITLSLPSDASGSSTQNKGPLWNSAWHTVTPAEYAVFGTLAAGDAAALIWLPAPTSPNWTAPNAFDTAVRNTLRLSSPTARNVIDKTSTGVVAGLAAFPVLVDAAGIAWFGHHDGKAATQMLAIDAEAFATILAAGETTKTAVARARPYMTDCPNSNCSNSDRFESFFSVHTALAFNSAGLICSEHLNMHLWGSEAADVATCVAALATATTVGVMRPMADMHYGTDVLVGGALGAASGFLIPQLHFGFGHSGAVDADGREVKDVTLAIAPIVTQQEQGLGVSGAF